LSEEEERNCLNCKYLEVEEHKDPCRLCNHYAFWKPNEEEKICVTCKHEEVSFFRYPCKECYEREFWEPKEEKECKDCRHRGIGCECSEPCKNHDRWEPKEEKEKISMADICAKFVLEKQMHGAAKYIDKKRHDMVDAITDAMMEITFENNPGAAASDCVKEFDTVHKPSHYAKGRRFEPKDVIADWELGFNLGNALKYISRCGRKGDPIEDLQKAKEFIDFEISEYRKSRDKKDFENFVKTHKDEIKEALEKMEDDLK
jgi:hypothetical protein